MKKNQLKIILLLILSSLMIYIWWGNFQSFSHSNSSKQIDSVKIKTNSVSKVQKELVFRKPKLNPFKVYAKTQQVSKPMQQQRQKPQQSIPKLSSQYKLQGIISENKSSQAIITRTDGNSSILSLHDVVLNWKLIQIDENFIIFKNDKTNDTLYLQTIK